MTGVFSSAQHAGNQCKLLYDRHPAPLLFPDTKGSRIVLGTASPNRLTIELMHASATSPTLAPLRIRLAAMIYESLLIAAVAFVASFAALPLVGDLHTPWQRHLYQAWLLAVLFGYFAAFWLRGGQTLAMKTWRIRLVDRDGARITPRQAVLRFAVALGGICLGGVGLWWAFIDRDHQFLHDRIAGTLLIRVPRP